MDQQPLWHDSLEHALGALIDACGGPKKVGKYLWGESLSAEDAARRIRHNLDPDRRERFSNDELILLLALGREHNCHIAAAFINRRIGYAPPQPIDPEDEVNRLKREYIETGKRLERLFSQHQAAEERLKLVRSA